MENNEQQEKQPKKKGCLARIFSGCLTVIVGIAILGGLLYMRMLQEDEFFKKSKEEAITSCAGDDGCETRMNSNFDDCIEDNHTSRKSGKFNRKYTFDLDGFIACVDQISPPENKNQFSKVLESAASYSEALTTTINLLEQHNVKVNDGIKEKIATENGAMELLADYMEVPIDEINDYYGAPSKLYIPELTPILAPERVAKLSHYHDYDKKVLYQELIKKLANATIGEWKIDNISNAYDIKDPDTAEKFTTTLTFKSFDKEFSQKLIHQDSQYFFVDTKFFDIINEIESEYLNGKYFNAYQDEENLVYVYLPTKLAKFLTN